MKKLLLFSFFILFLTLSCSKDDSKGASATDDGFVYSENGDAKLIALKNPKANAQKNEIIAGTEDAIFIQFDISSLKEGTYDFSNVPYNTMDYFKTNGVSIRTWTANSGTLTITANANNRISGKFNVTGEKVDNISSLSGSFNNIPIE